MEVVTPGVRGHCGVCEHSQRPRIDLAIVAGVGYSALSRKYGVSRHSVGRHAKKHITEERRAQLVAGPVKWNELAERAAESGLSLLDYLSMLKSSLSNSVLEAGDAKDWTAQGILSGRLTDVVKLEAQFTGELTKHTAPLVQVNNVAMLSGTPDFARFQAKLIRALARYPEARAAILAEFAALEPPPAAAPPVALPAASGEVIDATP
jgi:hypothetical protein